MVWIGKDIDLLLGGHDHEASILKLVIRIFIHFRSGLIRLADRLFSKSLMAAQL